MISPHYFFYENKKTWTDMDSFISILIFLFFEIIRRNNEKPDFMTTESNHCEHLYRDIQIWEIQAGRSYWSGQLWFVSSSCHNHTKPCEYIHKLGPHGMGRGDMWIYTQAGIGSRLSLTICLTVQSVKVCIAHCAIFLAICFGTYSSRPDSWK